MLFQNILATLCYYDCLDFPLTAFEVWRNLINSHQPAGRENYPLLDIMDNLEELLQAGKIEEDRGFYFIQGRKNLVLQRIERNKISAGKIKRLRKYVKILRFVPFVRMVAITGRLAMKNAEAKSDWDVLIVLEKGRIWTGRFLVTLAVHLLGARRYGNRIRNRICLNHFLTKSSLEIKLQDLFSAHEYSWIRPVFDAGVFNKFQIRNSWIRDYRPNYSLAGVKPSGIIPDDAFSSNLRHILEKIFIPVALEDKLREWQKKKIEKNPKTALSGSYIEATDEALVFLPEPQGPKIYECYMEKIKRYNL